MIENIDNVYKQCEMVKTSGEYCTRIVSWIPECFATKDKIVFLTGVDGEWRISNVTEPGVPLKCIQTYTEHTYASLRTAKRHDRRDLNPVEYFIE